MPRASKHKPRPERGQRAEYEIVRAAITRDSINLTGAKCDGTSELVLAKTNGQSITLYMIKATGKCGGTVQCLDNNKQVVAGSAQAVKKGAVLPVYVAPLGTDVVTFKCDCNEDTSDGCSVEVSV